MTLSEAEPSGYLNRFDLIPLDDEQQKKVGETSQVLKVHWPLLRKWDHCPINRNSRLAGAVRR